MGAPKQKWTNEEESALKAGVVKHGSGKWRTILKDPEFSHILYLRSNVDLKVCFNVDHISNDIIWCLYYFNLIAGSNLNQDKWRNMSVMANGWGSREKARIALKRIHSGSKDDNPLALANVDDTDDDSGDGRALPSSSGSPQTGGSKRSMIRFENFIMLLIYLNI